MSTDHARFKHGMAMCRKCGHDLYVVRNGAHQGEVRCSNRKCKWASRRYVMGKTLSEGTVAA